MKKYLSTILISFIVFVNLFTPIFGFSVALAGNEEVRIDLTLKPDGKLGVSIDGIFRTDEKVDSVDVAYFVSKNSNDLEKNALSMGGSVLNKITKYSESKTTDGKTIYNYEFGKQVYQYSQTPNYYDFVKGDTYFTKVMVFKPLADGKEAKYSSKVIEFKAGEQTSVIIAANQKEKEDPAVEVKGAIGMTENKTRYNFLAPLGKIVCMDWGDNATGECIGNNLSEYLNFIFKFGIGVCAALAVIMLIINGITYMGDESIFGKTEAKKKMFSAIGGLFIALAAWALLNTINPALTGKNGLRVDQVNIEIVRNRVNDQDFIKNISEIDTSKIKALGYDDPLFLGYLAHQQGPSGAAAILWSASKGLSSVPKDNPFTKSDINLNMKSNFPTDNAQKVIGTSVLTPANFLKYWSLKTAASKAKTNPIFPSIETALKKVSSETGVPMETLVAICRIESAAGCTSESSITKSNGSFQGLFQIGSAVWGEYGNKNGNILDPYENALAAAKYYKSNIQAVKSKLSKNS